MANVILSLDIGTTKIAAIAYDTTVRKTVLVVSAANSSTVSGLPGGRHEQEPELILQTCLSLLRQLINSGEFNWEDVRTIAISGQMHGVLLVDGAVKPLTNLMTWCDQRAAGLTSGIDRKSWPAERTGCYLHPGYGGATLAVLAAEKRISAGAKALTIADFVAAGLCGVIATEPTHAGSWGIMNVHENCWDREIAERLGIPMDVLPEIKPGMSELGTLKVDLGLPKTVTVRSPLGDNQASYIGSCGIDVEALLLNLGTGGQISLPCRSYTFVPELENRPLPFGGYLLVGASLCGGRSYALLKDFFRSAVSEFTGKELSDRELYSVMDRLAEEAADSVKVDTRFAGTRMNPGVRGRIENIDVESLTPAAFCRGVTRGMVDELIDMIPKENLKSLTKVLVSGNAVRKSPLAKQFITEALGVACEQTDTSEEAAAGAAMAAAKAGGWL